jgi:hypothetical protein
MFSWSLRNTHDSINRTKDVWVWELRIGSIGNVPLAILWHTEITVYIYVGVLGLSRTSTHAIRFVQLFLQIAENSLCYIPFVSVCPSLSTVYHVILFGCSPVFRCMQNLRILVLHSCSNAFINVEKYLLYSLPISFVAKYAMKHLNNTRRKMSKTKSGLCIESSSNPLT